MSFNNIADDELELLYVLLEELGESVQQVGKILRHGYTALDHCVHPPREYDNRKELEIELGQVRMAMIMLCEIGVLDKEKIHRAADERRAKLLPYLHHN